MKNYLDNLQESILIYLGIPVVVILTFMLSMTIREYILEKRYKNLKKKWEERFEIISKYSRDNYKTVTTESIEYQNKLIPHALFYKTNFEENCDYTKMKSLKEHYDKMPKLFDLELKAHYREERLNELLQKEL